MAIKVETLYVDIEVDSAGANKGIKALGQTSKKAESSIKGLATSLIGANLAARAITASARATLKFFKDSSRLASEAEETISLFNAVYRDLGITSAKTAEQLKDDFNLATGAAEELLGGTGDLLTGFGFTQEAALEMSEKVARLGLDLASFTNYAGGSEGAVKALTKALLGETEQAKGLNIVIRQNSKEFRASVSAIMAATGATEQQAKAQAILKTATEQSKNAIGDYANTADSTENTTKRLEAAYKSLGIEVGKTVNKRLTPLKAVVADILALMAETEAAANLWSEADKANAKGQADLNQQLILKQKALEGINDSLVNTTHSTAGWAKFALDAAKERKPILEAEIALLKKEIEAYNASTTATQKATAKANDEAKAIADRQAIADEAYAAMADGIREIDKLQTLSLILGEEYNAQLEKRKLLSEVTQGLISEGFEAEGASVRYLIALYGELLEASTIAAEDGAAENIRWAQAQADEVKLLQDAQTVANQARYDANMAMYAAEAQAEKDAFDQKMANMAATATMFGNMGAAFGNYIQSQIDGEEELSKEKRAKLLQAFAWQKAAQTGQAIASAAGAITRQFADLPIWLAIPSAVAVAAATATQIAAITSQKPGFATGSSPSGYVVPPGYEGDNYPVKAKSGERVTVSNGDSGDMVQVVVMLDSSVLASTTTRLIRDRKIIIKTEDVA